ncbi:MAG: hypothetical protein ACI9OS_000547 [Ulvibacter sp.]|jgi:hypothetical protein
MSVIQMLCLHRGLFKLYIMYLHKKSLSNNGEAFFITTKETIIFDLRYSFSFSEAIRAKNLSIFGRIMICVLLFFDLFSLVSFSASGW